ncbi:MAG: hypothetical protein ACJAT1_001097 [Marivirga sp.]|jgi:hypothetical protein
MSPILKYLLSSLFLVSVCQAQVRNPTTAPASITSSQDTVRLAKPAKKKVPKSFYIPTGIRIGPELVNIGINVFGNTRQRYEFQADVDFHRIYLAGSYGITSVNISGVGFDYTHNGSYYRIGLDANFLKYDPDFNTFTVGFRIARANYAEQLITDQTDPIFGSYSDSFSNNSVQANWFEITTGLRVMVWNNFYTGYTFRIQLNRKVINATNFSSYDIPGFGRAQFGSRWDFNYYLMYRISWKQKQVLPRAN